MNQTKRNDHLSGIISAAEKRLAGAGIDNPKLDARVLTAHALHLDRAQLLSQFDRVLNDKEKRHIEVLIECRARHEPVARILRTREFWSLSFGLNEATLVPRPESELIVEMALARTPNPEPRILDLGTGSGCLLLSLLHELPHATGIGVDSAARAVEQAKHNAERLGLAARAEFRLNNWADGIDECFDIIVSNPPYIARTEIAALVPEVRDYDPHPALNGGADGLDAYRQLIPQLPNLLKSNGAAVFEIGVGQAQAVRSIFQKSGFKKIKTRRDLAGIERCLAVSA